MCPCTPRRRPPPGPLRPVHAAAAAASLGRSRPCTPRRRPPPGPLPAVHAAATPAPTPPRTPAARRGRAPARPRSDGAATRPAGRRGGSGPGDERAVVGGLHRLGERGGHAGARELAGRVRGGEHSAAISSPISRCPASASAWKSASREVELQRGERVRHGRGRRDARRDRHQRVGQRLERAGRRRAREGGVRGRARGGAQRAGCGAGRRAGGDHGGRRDARGHGDPLQLDLADARLPRGGARGAPADGRGDAPLRRRGRGPAAKRSEAVPDPPHAHRLAIHRDSRWTRGCAVGWSVGTYA